MRETLTKIAIVVGGLIATLSPIALSVYEVDREGRRAEQVRVRSYAQDALFRLDEVTAQMAAAFKSLASLEAKEGACSPSGIAEMRRIDLAYRYIQAVGKVAGTQMQCSSLGLSGADMELGPVDAVQPSGVRLRKDVRLPFARDVSFLVVEQSGYAAIINKNLPIDTALGVEGVALATFSKATGNILTGRGSVDPAWIERFLQTGEEYFVTDAHVVSILGSKRFHIGTLAAMPASTMLDRLRNAFLVLIPIGIAAGLLIAGLFIHLAHRQRALPAVIRHALRMNEFFLMYQPVVDLRSGRWVRKRLFDGSAGRAKQ
ncbi:MAG TPA: CSS-motif domain-containing protein [Aestuariivirga sp.]|nr:CSS-motif domain-containing protein [Aestuariivirga sp.]